MGTFCPFLVVASHIAALLGKSKSSSSTYVMTNFMMTCVVPGWDLNF